MTSEAKVPLAANKNEGEIASPLTTMSTLRDDDLETDESGQESLGGLRMEEISGVSENHDDDDDDNVALARMMAYQEEQHLETNDDVDERVAGNVGYNDDSETAAQQHRNLNNPAAVALQQHQAMQNADNNNNNNNAAANLLPDNNQRKVFLRSLFSFLRPSMRYVPLSFLSAFLLLHHTLRTRQQFFLATTYLQSSKLSYIILGNAIIAFYVQAFTMVTHLFLDGGLRSNERESIGEQMRWDVTETCLALTMFRSELDIITAIKFLTLVVMKG